MARERSFCISQFLYPVNNPQTDYCPELYIAPWNREAGILKIFGPDHRVFLSPEERQRAQNFSNEEERKRFIAARLLLRCLLSQKSPNPVHPSHWEFRTGPHGKPYLSGPPFWENSTTLAQINTYSKQVFPQFNLSHSGNYIALAFSEYASLGVDIELSKNHRDMRGIAQLVFTPDETKTLQELLRKGEEAQKYFYRLWCRYEAVGKLEGGGLLQRPPNFKNFGNSRNLGDSQDFFSSEGNFRCLNSLYFWALCWNVPEYSACLPVQ